MSIEKKFNRPKKNKFRNNVKDNFITETAEIKAVSNTTKGGRQRSLSIAIIAGDGEKAIGIGRSKAKSLANASRSAMAKAQKKLKEYDLEALANGNSLTHTTTSYSCGVTLRMSPRKNGGLKGHKVIIKMLKCLKIQHAVCKIHGNSTAIQNIMNATLACLEQQETMENYSKRLGIPLSRVKERIYANLWRKQ